MIRFAAWLLLGLTMGRGLAAERKPNVVYILADDLGYGDVQCLNPTRGKIRTPQLDRLASQGMRFTDAHSGASVCTPTRYGLLTGRYAWRTRLQAGVFDGLKNPPLIAPQRLTVGKLFQQHGYTTAALGKWHLGFDPKLPEGNTGPDKKQEKEPADGDDGKPPAGTLGMPVGTQILEGPVTRGFDYFWGCSNARTMSGLIENGRVIETIKPADMLPRLADRAVAYVTTQAAAARAGRPFFLYLPLTSPHTPILPSPEWQGKSGIGDYGDFVMQTDAVVGRVLEALETKGLAEHTLVIFTSDNGCAPAAGTPDLEKQGHFASAAFRGYKSDVWEGGHRVPFLVRWPGQVKAGSQSGALICHTDFMATAAEILGSPLPPDAAEDSVSFLPVLRGEERPPLREAVVHHSINGQFAIRQGHWKLEFCPGSGGWGKPRDPAARTEGLPGMQLYDLQADPAETNNRQAESPEITARLTALLTKYLADGRSTPGPPQANDVPVQHFPLPARK